MEGGEGSGNRLGDGRMCGSETRMKPQFMADCFFYALAKLRNEPLLFSGDDFAKTDVVVAWRP